MKRLFSALALLGLALRAAAQPALSPADQVKAMQRGVNVFTYEALWKDTAKAKFKPRHFKTIKDAGFATVRLALEAFHYMNDKEELPAKWFTTLDGLVDDALAQNLTVIIDEHDYNLCGSDVATCRPRLMAFWTQVGEHYKDAPNNVVFEILNEPNEAMNAVWNDVLVEALAVVRKTNPTRNVIIGPTLWNNVDWIDRLKLPKDDRHIIVTVHYYYPTRFTYQGARWMPAFANLSGITWGSAEDYAAIDRDFDRVQKWAKANDRPILLGEFGSFDKAPMESRAKYAAAVARAAEKRGWAWAYWQFDGDFVVYDMDKDQWVEAIRRALIP